MKVEFESEVTLSCPTLSDPMDCSPPGSSVHGIFQARVLEWGATAFSLDKGGALRIPFGPFMFEVFISYPYREAGIWICLPGAWRTL